MLAVLYFLYVWDVVLFGYLAYLDSLWYLLVMTVGWLILDYFSIYVPLTPLRAIANTAGDEVPNEAPEEDSIKEIAKEITKEA